VNRSDQETAKRRGPTRAVDPFKKKRKKNGHWRTLTAPTLRQYNYELYNNTYDLKILGHCTRVENSII
jgi:hypothetical protein